MSNEVLFDISMKGYNWFVFTLGILMAVIGIIGLKIQNVGRFMRIHPLVVLCIGLVLGIGHMFYQYNNKTYYRDALEQGRYSVIEGIVTDFTPMPWAGHANETFHINGIRFSYSDYSLTPAFNTSRSHGGPIREGIYLKVFYTASREFAGERAILRIEIP